MLRRGKTFQQSIAAEVTCPLYCPHVLNPLQLLSNQCGSVQVGRAGLCLTQQVLGLSGSCHWSVNWGGSTPTPPAQGAHELEHVAETPPAESLAASALQAKQPPFNS